MKKLLIHNNNSFLINPNYFKLEEQFVFSFNSDNSDIDGIIDNEITRGELYSKIINADILFIKISLSKNYLEYIGLRLAYHIRLTEILKEKTTIPIVFVAEESIQFVGVTSNIPSLLFTKGIYFMKDNKSELEKYTDLMKNQSLQKSKMSSNLKNDLNLPMPSNYSSHHSIDNELSLLKWSKITGIYDQLPFEKLEFHNSLYFKLNNDNNPFTNNKETLYEIKNKGKVLLIDDEFDKGWHIFYKDLFNKENVNFNSIQLNYRKSKQEDVIQNVIKEVKKNDPDVILLDLRLTENDFNKQVNSTKLTGYKILELIKDFDQGIRVIIITASNKSWNFKALQDIGANDYIIKSADQDSLNKLNYLKKCIDTNIAASYFLKFLNNKIIKIQQLIEDNNSTIDSKDIELVNKIKYNLKISFELAEKYEKDVKYLSFAYLQLFHIIEYFLGCEKIFYEGDKCFVSIKNEIEVLVLSVDKIKNRKKSFKSAITWSGGNYKINKSIYSNRIDTNFKMSSVLIFKYGLQTSGEKKWTKIYSNRNEKAAHAGGIISKEDIEELLLFLEFVFDKSNISTINKDKGLTIPSFEEETQKLKDKFNKGI